MLTLSKIITHEWRSREKDCNFSLTFTYQKYIRKRDSMTQSNVYYILIRGRFDWVKTIAIHHLHNMKEKQNELPYFYKFSSC